MKKRVLVPLAAGFEEIEAVTIIDVLRRAGVEVTVAGLATGPIAGAHGLRFAADCLLADVLAQDFDAIVLPGGMGGTRKMMQEEGLLQALRVHAKAGRLTAAICAAPLVLERAGLTTGRRLTAHPSVQAELSGGEVCPKERLVHAGHLCTSQGPGTAMEFALALVEQLVDAKAARELARAMVVA